MYHPVVEKGLLETILGTTLFFFIVITIATATCLNVVGVYYRDDVASHTSSVSRHIYKMMTWSILVRNT